MEWFKVIDGVHRRGIAWFVLSVALIVVTLSAAPAASAWPMCGT